MLIPSQFRTTTPLADLSVRYANALEDYAALKLFPARLVDKSAFSFYIAKLDNLRVQDPTAPSGTEAPSGEYQYTTASASTKEYAWKGLILDRDKTNADAAVADLETAQAMHNMDILMLHLEIAAATKAQTSGNYPAALTAASGNWGTAGTDVFSEFDTAKEAVKDSCLKQANMCVLNKKALRTLARHPDVVDRVKYTSQASAKALAAALSDLFELEFVIADARKNTANKGATDAISRVWGAHAVIAHVNPAQGLKTMTYGSTFFAQSAGLYTKTIEKPELGRGQGARELESGWEFSVEAVAQDSTGDFSAGYLLTTVYS